ncbi:uncharacterized protein PITG_04637 [Phytophthora infestans T30-4]|uniref:Uncharacterized protein n=1 Tax=Phytophthora infestans (strain T30-4) TaxID=403677 RepID=D0N1P2_PHYIT|nr:uncharacterized protein PITG_04637 [Phytophthora infestans T30-4]EEY68221.1 conserved hypothetical protein [Phytophthora infestans T30-4]|eukprot:XP_002905380.1 conserved hypothetical protein [Phytophthora infestans T30-4]
MLDASRMKRLHGDWETISRLRYRGLTLLYDSKPRFSLLGVRFDVNDVTDDTFLTFYKLTHRQLRRLQASFKLPDVIRTGSHSPYPTRWMDMATIYGRWPSALSSIFYFLFATKEAS